MTTSLKLDQVTAADFEPFVGSEFALPGGTCLVLQESTAGHPVSSPMRQPFILVFDGPADVALPQQIYPLEHDSLGTLELFLVPIGAGTHSRQYQAVFN